MKLVVVVFKCTFTHNSAVEPVLPVHGGGSSALKPAASHQLLLKTAVAKQQLDGGALPEPDRLLILTDVRKFLKKFSFNKSCLFLYKKTQS